MHLNHKIIGSGDPIVILHGLFGMLDNWSTFANKLADDFTVILLDLRDHGKSPRTNEFSYPLLAKDVYEFLDKSGIRKTHIMGHSMGGKVAIQLAHDYEYSVDKLIVVDIAPKAYSGGHEKIFEALLSANVQNANTRESIHLHLKKYVQEENVIQFLLKNLQRMKEGGYQWKMNVKTLYKNYPVILDNAILNHHICNETLFVRGSLSNYIREEDEPVIFSIFPNSIIKTIDGAGHWVHAEKPSELLDLVKNFLNQ